MDSAREWRIVDSSEDAKRLAADQELQFSADNVQALAAVVWSEGNEFAIAFDIPIAVAEVVHLRSLANI